MNYLKKTAEEIKNGDFSDAILNIMKFGQKIDGDIKSIKGPYTHEEDKDNKFYIVFYDKKGF